MGQKIKMHRPVFVLSDALDMVAGKDSHHGKRVALMATACARALGWPEERCEHLFLCALVHDCGASSHHRPCDSRGNADADEHEDHGWIGYDYLLRVPTLKALAPAILHHHTPWCRLERMRLDFEVRLTANLIYLADRIDAVAGPQILAGAPVDREAVLATVLPHRGGLFQPDLVDMVADLAWDDGFWAMLTPTRIDRQIDREALAWEPETVDFAQIIAIASLFSRLVDAKSPFTARHSEGVAGLAGLLAAKLGLDEETCASIELAGLMHDLGKLGVPDEILGKPGPLSPAEWQIMRQHSLHTFRLVLRLVGAHPIASWAACHHETLRGDGYPFGIGMADLPIEPRILAVADVYQALAQNRPYRRSLCPDQVVDVLHRMAMDGRLDRSVVAAVRSNLAECHVAACPCGGSADGDPVLPAGALAGGIAGSGSVALAWAADGDPTWMAYATGAAGSAAAAQ